MICKISISNCKMIKREFLKNICEWEDDYNVFLDLRQFQSQPRPSCFPVKKKITQRENEDMNSHMSSAYDN